jgi:hypothetical protein
MRDLLYQSLPVPSEGGGRISPFVGTQMKTFCEDDFSFSSITFPSSLTRARILKHLLEAEKSTFKESCLFKGQSVQQGLQ